MNLLHPIRDARNAFNARAQAFPPPPPLSRKNRMFLSLALVPAFSLYLATFVWMCLHLYSVYVSSGAVGLIAESFLYGPFLFVCVWMIYPVLFTTTMAWLVLKHRPARVAS